MLIRQFLERRENPKTPVTVFPVTLLTTCVRLLCEHDIACAPVVEEGTSAVVGIITERDIMRRLDRGISGFEDESVGTLMTRDVITGTLHDEMHKVLRRMTLARIRHLPVIDGGRLAAVITVGDILRELFQEDETKLHHLNDFLGATYRSDVY